MAAIATIIAGAAMLLEGKTSGEAHLESGQPSVVSQAGLSADMLGAIAGIILGILALMGVAPMTLVAVAVLVSAWHFCLAAR